MCECKKGWCKEASPYAEYYSLSSLFLTDDIGIYSDTWEEHIETVERVFQRFKSAKLVINLSKSDFGKAEVKYLGHIVGYGKTTPTEAKTPDILKYLTPQNTRKLRRFWGMAGHNENFVRTSLVEQHL